MQAQEQRTTTIYILIYYHCIILFQELGLALLKEFASLVDDVFA